jgi:carbon storage regulator
MLILSRKPGQSFTVNDNIEITIVDISGDKVKIGIEAPKDVKILRNELLQTMEQNKKAAGSVTDKHFLEMITKPKT